MAENDLETHFKKISKSLMNTYQSEMHEFFNSQPENGLTDSDVIITVMNLSVAASVNIYYTLKQFLPNHHMDFDYMKAAMCNAISADFEKIKAYNPSDTMLSLTVEQVADCRENGFVNIKLDDGSTRKITLDEILVSRKDADKLLHEEKNRAKKISDTKKIITPPDGLFRK